MTSYVDNVYVIIVSADYGETWQYVDVRMTQEDAGKRLMELQRANPDCLYRFRTVSEDVLEALSNGEFIDPERISQHQQYVQEIVEQFRAPFRLKVVWNASTQEIKWASDED